jgi:hypothetical protein
MSNDNPRISPSSLNPYSTTLVKSVDVVQDRITEKMLSFVASLDDDERTALYGQMLTGIESPFGTLTVLKQPMSNEWTVDEGDNGVTDDFRRRVNDSIDKDKQHKEQMARNRIISDNMERSPQSDLIFGNDVYQARKRLMAIERVDKLNVTQRYIEAARQAYQEWDNAQYLYRCQSGYTFRGPH